MTLILTNGLLLVHAVRPPVVVQRDRRCPLMLYRERESRKQSPSAVVIDSNLIRVMAVENGGDAGKKIVRRKRHIAVNTHGRLLMVNLITADISDCAGTHLVVDSIRKRLNSEGSSKIMSDTPKHSAVAFICLMIRQLACCRAWWTPG